MGRVKLHLERVTIQSSYRNFARGCATWLIILAKTDSEPPLTSVAKYCRAVKTILNSLGTWRTKATFWRPRRSWKQRWIKLRQSTWTSAGITRKNCTEYFGRTLTFSSMSHCLKWKITWHISARAMSYWTLRIGSSTWTLTRHLPRKSTTTRILSQQKRSAVRSQRNKRRRRWSSRSLVRIISMSLYPW